MYHVQQKEYLQRVIGLICIVFCLSSAKWIHAHMDWAEAVAGN